VIRQRRAFRPDSQAGISRAGIRTRATGAWPKRPDRPGRSRRPLAMAALLSLALVATACASSAGSQSGAAAPITLGTSLSLTGALGSFGVDQQAGYQQAIADANAAGGIKVGGTRHRVKLVVLNNQSDPTTAAQQVRDLVLKDGAQALLGAGTPPITVPQALIAETLRVPYLTTNTPVGAFAAGSKGGWKYSWDMFFSEKEQASGIIKAVGRFPTNHKIALFTDNEPDGVVERPLYKAAAAAAGDQVVGDFSFPVGTSDFTSFITQAKAKGAQVVVGQMDPPDAVTLFKQMKSLGYAPKIGIVAKAADFIAWVNALGSVAEGSLLEAVWLPSWNYPGTSHIEATLGKRFDNLGDLGTATAAYSVVNVMLNAFERAGSTDASRVNTALGATSLATPYGHVRFADHTATMGFAVAQWQGTKTIPVWPPSSGAHLEFPMKGL
jgi:branched-chain amino acid transport system substrate-binding protein